MGKRSRQFEEEERLVWCKVCGEDIDLEYYLDRGDLVCCEACGSEFIIKSSHPVVLYLLEEEDDDYFEEDDYDDDDFFDRV